MGIIAALLVVIFLAGLHVSRLDSKIDKQVEQLATKQALIAAKDASISMYQKQASTLRDEIGRQERLLSYNKQAVISINNYNTILKLKIEGLRDENEAIKVSLDTIVHRAVVGVLYAGERANSLPADDGIYTPPILTNGANAGTENLRPKVRSMKQVINYCQDMQQALHSCNADKASLREWRAVH